MTRDSVCLTGGTHQYLHGELHGILHAQGNSISPQISAPGSPHPTHGPFDTSAWPPEGLRGGLCTLRMHGGAEPFPVTEVRPGLQFNVPLNSVTCRALQERVQGSRGL